MRPETTSYKEVESRLRSIAHQFQSKESCERSPFRGNNFMTPNIIARRKLANGIWLELSYDKFIKDWILGVTLMDNKGTDFEDIQGCVDEFSEVEAILEKARGLALCEKKTN